MRLRTVIVLAMLASSAAPLEAQDRNLLQLELSPLSASGYYGRRVGATLFVGFGAGAGPEGWERVLVSGPHYDPDDDPQLADPADEFDETLHLAEWMHVSAGAMWLPRDRFQLDVGVRLSAVIWSRGSGGGDGTIALFEGAYIAPKLGWRNVKVGPRLLFGFLDSGPGSDSQAVNDDRYIEPSILFVPLVVSLTHSW